MAKKLKIGFLLLHKYGGKGGTEAVLSSVVAGLKPEFESFVYFVQEPHDFNFVKTFDNSRCFRVPNFLRNKHPLRPRLLYKAFLTLSKKKLFATMSNDALDALIVLDLGEHLNKCLPYLKSIKNKGNTKIISWTHLKLPVFSSKQKQALEIFDVFFTISNGIAKQIKNLGFTNIQTIYNPIKKAELIKRSENHFLYVGRIDSNKRVEGIVDAFANINESDYILDIYGSTGNERDDRCFDLYIKNKNLKGTVRFHGWKDNPWDLISEATILLLNSKKEGFPLVLCEAMMRGVACLSSNCPTGPDEIIQHDQNGWLFNVDDQQQLKAYIEEIIQGKRAIPDPAAIQNSVAKFNYETVMNNFKNSIYQTLKRSEKQSLI